jgi:hypothetical protein
MRVAIEHKEAVSGLIKKVLQVEVTTVVQFSEEERAIIDSWNLGDVTVVERQMDGQRAAKYKGDQYSAQAPYEHLRIGQLTQGPDRYLFDTPHDAKVYQEQLVEGLKTLKSYLANCASLAEPQVFEI